MSKENRRKVHASIKALKANAEFYYTIEAIETENHFNQINWVTGVDENNRAITTTTCPHSEIDWTKFKTEYDKL